MPSNEPIGDCETSGRHVAHVEVNRHGMVEGSRLGRQDEILGSITNCRRLDVRGDCFGLVRFGLRFSREWEIRKLLIGMLCVLPRPVAGTWFGMFFLDIADGVDSAGARFWRLAVAG